MRIKSKDIAKALGVSEATVSLVLNDRPGVNEKTKQKVLSYVEKLTMNEQKNYHNSALEGTVVMLNYVKHGIVLTRDVNSTAYPFSQIENTVRRAGYEFFVS